MNIAGVRKWAAAWKAVATQLRRIIRAQGGFLQDQFHTIASLREALRTRENRIGELNAEVRRLTGRVSDSELRTSLLAKQLNRTI